MKYKLTAAIAASLLSLNAGAWSISLNPSGIPDDNVRAHLEGIAFSASLDLTWSEDGRVTEGVALPITTLIGNLSRTYIIDNVYGPSTSEPNSTVGSYAIACLWWEWMTGGSAIGNSYTPPHMELEPDRVEIAQLCAHAAMEHPEKSTNIHWQFPREIFSECQVPAYTLPDPLRFENGKPVRTRRQWTDKRRKELLELFTTEMFGRMPGRPEALHFETLYRDENALGGKAVRKEVKVHFDNSGKHYLKLLIYTPKNAKGPVPAFLGANFKGNWGISYDEGILMPTEEELKAYGIVENLERGKNAIRWPLEKIVDAGYGIATFYRADLDPDYDDGFRNGVHPLFYAEGQDYPKADEWGSISAWAWGYMRALDYLETDPDIDATKVAVFGHSRLGKTSLWAGAVDERFAMVISNCSGNCGAALSRRHFGETIKKVNCYRPQWFCDNFLKYNDNEAALPFDQHELIALIAPRPVYVASANLDIFADPKGEYEAIKAASPVYALFGLEGLEDTQWPGVNEPVGKGRLRYHMREGKHDILDYDWDQYIKFADEYLK